MFGLFGQQAPGQFGQPFGQQSPFTPQQQMPGQMPQQPLGQFVPGRQPQNGLFGSPAQSQNSGPPAQNPAAPPPMQAPMAQTPTQEGPGPDGLGYVRDAMGDYGNLMQQKPSGGGGMNMQQAMQFAKMFAGG